jgi:hypothetical protein
MTPAHPISAQDRSLSFVYMLTAFALKHITYFEKGK